MQCKSLWIKASAKWINVNVNTRWTHLWYSGFLLISLSGRPSSSSSCSIGSTVTGLGKLSLGKADFSKPTTINTHFNKMKAADTHTVRRKAPSPQRSRAFLAEGLLANSTMPFPVGLPRSSTMTMARSIGPNMAKASSRSSLDTNWGRFLTVSTAPWVAERTRIWRPRNTVSSSSAFAMSARVFVS